VATSGVMRNGLAVGIERLLIRESSLGYARMSPAI
jgi:hypothetical protein